jgi:serine/threonine protein kinase
MEEDDVFNSYGACNMELTRPFSDLNLVTITTNLKEEVEDLPEKFTFKLFYDGHKMSKRKIITDGANGKIYIYKYKNYSVVIKIPIEGEEIDDEVNVIKDIVPTNCNMYIIPYKIIYDKYNNPFVIMQEANGTLDELNLESRLISKIIIEITKMLICFYDMGIVYYDLKSDNILYKCMGNKIALFLGDIGSFANENDGISGGYYLPPEALDSTDTKATKELLIFTIGAFAADLYDFQEELGYKETGGRKELEEEEYPKFVKKIRASNIPRNIKALILTFTDMNPKRRRKLELTTVFDLLEIENI